MNKIINLIVCISIILALSSCNSSQEAGHQLGYISIGISIVALLLSLLTIAFIWKPKESEEEIADKSVNQYPDLIRRIVKLEKELPAIERNFNESIQEDKDRLSELEQQFKQLTADDDKKATTPQ